MFRGFTYGCRLALPTQPASKSTTLPGYMGKWDSFFARLDFNLSGVRMQGGKMQATSRICHNRHRRGIYASL